jgi:transposase InsO family protein
MVNGYIRQMVGAFRAKRHHRAGVLLHHSDQGSQYTGRKYRALLKDHSIRASMNGAGS